MYPITMVSRPALLLTLKLARRLAQLLSRLHRKDYYAFDPADPLDKLLVTRDLESFELARGRHYRSLPPASWQRAEMIAGDLRFFARAVCFWLNGQDPEQFDPGQVPNLPRALAPILRRAWDGDYASGVDLLYEIEQITKRAAEPTAPLATPSVTPPAFRPPASVRTVSHRAAYHSDVGLQRTSNEDRAWAGPIPGGYLCIVCDGMGGHEAGEVAAEMALATIHQHLQAGLAQPGTRPEPGVLLAAALTEANRQVFEASRVRASDMGTTVVAALVIGATAYLANAGDSRAYLFRAGQLTQVTQDHSLVASLVLAGALAPEEVYSHPRRNEIYRFLGNKADLVLDPVAPVALQPGDRLLLCSDGLWEMVRDPQIAQVLASVPEPDAACQRLIQLANEHGGEDNISAIILKVE